jgi:hypothetical protein
MKSRKKALFGDGDKVKLAAGTLYRGLAPRLTIPRGALEAIKARGWLEAVRTSESLDRRVVEGWPTERLSAIGARFRQVERFSYQAAPPPKPGRAAQRQKGHQKHKGEKGNGQRTRQSK